ncbi:MAG: hypothetical protein ACR2O3_09735 [Rhizobiaceae bacterium]
MKTADEWIEEGVGLIARGMYRKAEQEGDRQGAFDYGMAAVSTIRKMAFDFKPKSKE